MSKVVIEILGRNDALNDTLDESAAAVEEFGSKVQTALDDAFDAASAVNVTESVDELATAADTAASALRKMTAAELRESVEAALAGVRELRERLAAASEGSEVDVRVAVSEIDHAREALAELAAQARKAESEDVDVGVVTDQLDEAVVELQRLANKVTQTDADAFVTVDVADQHLDDAEQKAREVLATLGKVDKKDVDVDVDVDEQPVEEVSDAVSQMAKETRRAEEAASELDEELEDIEDHPGIKEMRDQFRGVGRELDELSHSVGEMGGVLGGVRGRMGRFTGGAVRGLKATTANVFSLGGALKTVVGGALAGVGIGLGNAIAGGAIKGLTALLGLFPTVIGAATESTAAQTRLASVLEATGEAAGYTMEQMNALAQQLKANTTLDDELITDTQAVIATFKNIKGDHFKQATELSADLARVMKTDLKSAALQVAKALNDPEVGLTALRRAGVSFSDQQSEVIKKLWETGDVIGAQKMILAELRSEFGGAASDAAQTFGGKLEQLKVRLGDLGEEVGAALIPALEEMTPLIDMAVVAAENLVPYIESATEAVIEFGKATLEEWKPALETALDVALGVFTGLEVVVTNWRDLWDAAVLSTALSIVGFAEDFKHIFTGVIPGLLDWFARNWDKVLVDAGNLWVTVHKNMWHNFMEFHRGVAKVLTFGLAGGDGPLKFKALTDGFEATLDELPEIAARGRTEVEQLLQEQLDDATGRVAESFDEKFRRNKKFLEDLFTKREDSTDVDLTPSFVPFDVGTEDTTGDKGDDKKKKDKEEKKDTFSAGIEDLVSLRDRIQSAAASEQEDPAKAVREAGKEQVAAAKDVQRAVEEVKDAVQDAATEVPDSVEEFVPGAPSDSMMAGVVAAVEEFGRARPNDELPDLTVDVSDLVSGLSTDSAHVGETDGGMAELIDETRMARAQSEKMTATVQAAVAVLVELKGEATEVRENLPIVGAAG